MTNCNSHKKISSKSKKNNKLRGGSSTNKKYVIGEAQKPMQKGGSPASNIVNQASSGPAVVNDFVTSPRVRDGPMAESYSGQCGGSDASKMTLEQLGTASITNKYPAGYNVKGNMDSLNLYQTTGGNRKNKKNNRNSKSKSRKHNNNNSNHNRNNSNSNRKHKKNNSRKNKKNMRGGGSDWISSQYSLGSYNGPEMSTGDVAKFSHSIAGTRADYMNPPNLGTAGSGYPMGSLEGANVRMTGAPLV